MIVQAAYRRQIGILLLCIGFCVPRSAIGGSLPQIPKDIALSIRQRVDNGHTASIIVGVINPHGRNYYGYGKTSLPDGKPPDENTIFEVGSVTKVFTGLLLADMAEKKQLALDDPIKRYLPDGVVAPTRNGQSIKLAHLATHTSGLPRLPDNMGPINLDNPYADYTAKQMYAFLSTYKLPRDIGEKYEYSNYGMGLLGHLLARSSVRTYEQLVRERIADKLGMSDTSITLTPQMQKRLAKGHRGKEAVGNWDLASLAGAGALRSTARDMLAFLAANIGLQDSPLRRAMRRTHKPRCQAGGENRRIGLAWHILIENDRRIHWHNGGTGGYFSFIGFDKAARTGIVVLTNSMHSVDDIGLRFFLPGFPLGDFTKPQQADQVIEVPLLPGEKLPVGEDVVERSIERTSGRQRLAKVRNRLTKATLQMNLFGRDIPGSMITYQAPPNKFYIKIQFPGMYTVEQSCDGDVVWEINSRTGTRVVTGRERAIMLRLLSFDMTNYKKLYRTIECVGRAELNGLMCYKMVFTPKVDCDSIVQYFAVDSGMSVRRDYLFQQEQTQIAVQSWDSDFKEVDGIVYPYHTREMVMGVSTHTSVESIEHNVQIQPGRFDIPESAKKLLDAEPTTSKNLHVSWIKDGKQITVASTELRST